MSNSTVKIFRLTIYFDGSSKMIIFLINTGYLSPDKTFFHSKNNDIFLYYSNIHNICCGYSLEVPHQGAFKKYPQHDFVEK